MNSDSLFFAPAVSKSPVGKYLTGFNPDALVDRGVFDSLDELDRVMCELDDVLAAPRVSRVGWSRGMDFNRARMGSGVVGEVGSNSLFGAAAKPTMTAPTGVKQSALCVFCAWERAAQSGPRMARPRFNGDVMLWPCARHESRPSTSNHQAAPASDAVPHPLPAA